MAVLRRRLWIGLSLGLHLALLWALSQVPPPATLHQAPIQLSLSRPPPLPTRPAALTPHAHPHTNPAPAPAPNLTPASPSPPDGHPTSGPRQPTPGADLRLPNSQQLSQLTGSLQRVEVPPGALTPFLDDGLDEKTRVAQRVKETTDAIAVALDTKTGARGTARLLRHALQDAFTPAAQLVQHIPNSAAARQQQDRNASESFLRPKSTDVYKNTKTPGQLEKTAGLLDLGDPCAVSHEVGRLELSLRADHDERGQVRNLTVLRGSGEPAFDRYAEGVVRAAAGRGFHAETDEATPLFSDWALSQIVYDWRAGGCFDSSLKVPGRPVFEGRYDITFTSEVKLVAVRYRREARRAQW